MSVIKLIGALSPLKLLQSSANNVLQPLNSQSNSQNTNCSGDNNLTNKNRNQNLLKAVNVTSARADSTGTENYINLNSSLQGVTTTKPTIKKQRGRAAKNAKGIVAEQSSQAQQEKQNQQKGRRKMIYGFHM